MSKKTIWGNCLVKNEDRYLWFAVKSVINYLDKILIWDTGSTDYTVRIIKKLQQEYPDKIIFKEIGQVNAAMVTKARAEMLSQTKSDWVLLIDGDEVWWEKSITEIVEVVNDRGDDLYAIITPVINVIGDIYHYQSEDAGQYEILGKKGHFNIRAINRNISGLHIKNDYPLEGFYDKKGILIQESGEEKLVFAKNSLMHFTYLPRSSGKGKDNEVIQRKQKIKYELGNQFTKSFQYPEVFYLIPPSFVITPWKKRSKKYLVRASIETIIKKIKRRFLRNIKEVFNGSNR